MDPKDSLTYFTWEIFHHLSKHDGRSPVIVCCLLLHNEGIKHPPLAKNLILNENKI